MRSSSKGPQAMQVNKILYLKNGINNSKTNASTKVNTTMKRNTTNLPALGAV